MKLFSNLIFLAFLSLNCFAQSHRDSIDVINYHIKLNNIDFNEQSISANTDLKLIPKQENTSNFSLDLLALVVDSVKQEDNLLAFSYNDTILNISLDQSFNTTDTLDVSVFYHGNPVKDPSWGGFYFYNQYAFNMGVGMTDIPHNYGRVWFPCIDNFTDRATYDFSIHTEMNSKAVCNGMLTNIDTLVNGTDSSLVHHWHMSDAIPTYLASFACGSYSIIEWTYQGIEREIPVQLYIYPNDSAQAITSFANLDTITNIYETTYGAYPWERIGYVEVNFSSGAMEHTTNIAIGSYFINGNTDWEGLFAHELSHHWFGDYITCHQAEEMWINEGWATYSETIYKEFLYGKTAGKNYRRSAHKEVIMSSHTDDGGWYALNTVPLNTTYGATSYDKGASVVHSLRDYLGDELFFSSVQEMLTEKALQDVTSEEMRDVLSTHSGIDLSNFFNNWVFKPGLPHYKLDSFIVTNNGDIFNTEIWVKQQLYGRNTISDGNLVNLCFLDENYEIHEERLVFDGEFGNAEFELDFNPIMVIIDINEKCSDAKTSQFGYIKTSGSKSFSNELFSMNVNSLNDSAFFYVSHHWGAPDQLKTPIEGLILANHRYYHIDGDFQNNLSASASFSYNTSSMGTNANLDSDFITNSQDSIRIVYRPNPQTEWQIVENQSISSFMKKINIENLLPGEYTLAIYDWDAYHSINNNHTFDVSVYPNPSSGQVFIRAEKDFDGQFYILNSIGHEILTAKINSNNPVYNWQCNTASGLYYVIFKDKSGKQKTEKIIIQ